MKQLYQNILNVDKGIHFHEEDMVSDFAKDFIQKILRKNPQDRLKIEEIKHHPFIFDVLTIFLNLRNLKENKMNNKSLKVTHSKLTICPRVIKITSLKQFKVNWIDLNKSTFLKKLISD